MRIIAGRLGGRSFVSPHGHHTRPMADKVRGALFNSLGDITGLSVLDAFGGSGALSYEALSRGAARAVVIDSDQAAQRAIAANIASLGLQQQLKLVKANAGAWLRTTAELFDIVLFDPPYDQLQPQLLAKLAERARAGGVVVLSLPPNAAVSLADEYKLLATKSYGDANLVFYRHFAVK